MLFHWLKQRRRRKLLAEPFPREPSRYLERDVPFHKALTKEERKRLEGIARILTEEKNWEGCGGLTMDEEIKLNISAQAALLILNMDHDHYQSRPLFLALGGGWESVGAERRRREASIVPKIDHRVVC